MSKVKKNLERYIDEVLRESLNKNQYLDDPIINVKDRSISISGSAYAQATSLNLIEFDKKGENIQKESITHQNWSKTEIMVQEIEFNNQNEFDKAISKKYKKYYKKAKSFVLNLATAQKGVDMIESIPGVSDMQASFIDFYGKDFTSFM